MATRLNKRPSQKSDNSDNPTQDYYDDQFNNSTSPEHMGKDGEEPNLYDRESKPDKNDGAPLEPWEQAKVDQMDAGLRENDLYQPEDSGSKKPLKTAIKGAFAGKRKFGWIGGGIGLISLVMVLFSSLSLELVHIKELLNLKVGQTSDTVLSSRSSKVYRRMYFFRDDGKFDGYKDKGLFGFLENKRSTRLLDDMRARGFDIEPELSPDGRWTGRVLSISLNGEELANLNTGNGVDNFGRQRRNAIKQSLEELFPERSRFWRSTQARKLYRRYNLEYLRGGWLKDTRLFTGVESLEFRLRQTLRDALFGDRDAGTRIGVPDAGEDISAEEAELEERLGGVSEDVDQIRSDLDEGRITNHVVDVNFDTGELVSSSARGAAGGALRGVSILGIADSACEVKRFAGLLQAGAVVLRSKQLISYAMIFFSAADAQKAGFLNSGVLGGFMNLLRQDSADGKHGLYDSGAYGWLLGNNTTVNPVNRDHYSVGGGFTGPLAIAYAVADENVSAETCGVVGNIFVQIGGVIVGVVAGIFTGGASLIASIGVSVAISIAAAAARAIAAPMIAEMLVGNIISWDETGEQYMDALVSGTGAMYAAQGANHGMKPLTVPEYVALKEEAEELQKARFAESSLGKRLLSIETPNSLAFNLFSRMPKTFNDAKNDLVAYVSSPLNALVAMTSIFMANSEPVYAQEASQCPDELAAQNNLATDPFCNPIYGESSAGLAIEPDDNFIYMIDNGYVDDSGLPQGDYIEFVERCVDKVSDYYHYDEVSGSFEYDNYCLLNDEVTLNFRAFSSYMPLVESIDNELNGVVGVPGFTIDPNSQLNEVLQ